MNAKCSNRYRVTFTSDKVVSVSEVRIVLSMLNIDLCGIHVERFEHLRKQRRAPRHLRNGAVPDRPLCSNYARTPRTLVLVDDLAESDCRRCWISVRRQVRLASIWRLREEGKSLRQVAAAVGVSAEFVRVSVAHLRARSDEASFERWLDIYGADWAMSAREGA